MGSTYFIVGDPVALQISGTLVELLTVLESHTVHHQVIVEMTCVHVGGHQYLEVRKLTLGQFQPHSVNLMRGQVILLVKGLYEVIVLSAVCLMELLLGKPHLIVDGPSSTVPAGYKPTIFPCGFLFLLDIAQHTAQSTAAATSVLDRGKGCHQVTSRSSSRSCS